MQIASEGRRLAELVSVHRGAISFERKDRLETGASQPANLRWVV